MTNDQSPSENERMGKDQAGLESTSETKLDDQIAKEEASTEVAHETSDYRLTPSERRTEWIQVITLCYALFVAGWNDGTTGPLLPTYQRVYSVGFAVVSLLFIFNCLVSPINELFQLVKDYCPGGLPWSWNTSVFLKPSWVWKGSLAISITSIVPLIIQL